ncbi:hypothetical protein PFISCL1PPCAC_9239, partial [Pristionchus fissidentatus]
IVSSTCWGRRRGYHGRPAIAVSRARRIGRRNGRTRIVLINVYFQRRGRGRWRISVSAIVVLAHRSIDIRVGTRDTVGQATKYQGSKYKDHAIIW